MRDLLTEEECLQICSTWGGEYAKLQAAARLGAEREREKCAELCDHLSTRAGTADDCAAAIRRGEGAVREQVGAGRRFGDAWDCHRDAHLHRQRGRAGRAAGDE